MLASRQTGPTGRNFKASAHNAALTAKVDELSEKLTKVIGLHQSNTARFSG